MSRKNNTQAAFEQHDQAESGEAFLEQAEQAAEPTGKALYTGKTPTEIFDMFGGESSRGGVSRTMRGLIAEGFTTGQVAKMLNKRYQHVRNVMKEPAKKA